MSWRSIQRSNFTKIHDLISFLELSPHQQKEIDHSPHFVLNVPRRLAEKMQKRTLDDPLLLQFVPLLKEKELHAGFSFDPVSDRTFQKESSKLLQKYEGRSLLITTSACVMNCRFCFRQNYPYETERKDFQEELQWLSNNRSIQEVILSGGDPLSLSNRILEELFSDLEKIDHIKRIRIHTRFPLGIPERIDEHFLALLKKCKKQVWFVLHTNHINEFDDDVWHAMKEIQKCGVPLLSQSVLLRDINDSKKALRHLFEGLVDHGIQPYYLHQLDRVQGAFHFEVQEKEGLFLLEELQKELSGYATPRYVREIPGEASKTTITGNK